MTDTRFINPAMDLHVIQCVGRISFSLFDKILNRTLQIPRNENKFALDPMIPPFVFHFSNICHMTTRKPRLPQCIMGDDLHINKQTDIYKNLIATKRGNVITQSWRSKSAVFRMHSPLTSHGYSKSIKAVRQQRNLGLT
jgi:hypothetical protein